MRLVWRVGSLAFCGLLFYVAVHAGEDQIRGGDELLRAMHDRYQHNWYETLTFTQKSTTYKPDGTTTSETWYEALSLPGKLRIDIGSPMNGNGYLFSDGNLTSFKNGKVAKTRPFVHMLVVLGFDVYGQDPKTTIDQVRQQGFDLTKFHEENWDGQPMYVVGADSGDLRSKQFWIEKKRLLFVRLIEPSDEDKTKMTDTRFVDYRQLSMGWVAARVDFLVDGKKTFGEEYSDIQINPKLDPAIFDPKQFATRHWEK